MNRPSQQLSSSKCFSPSNNRLRPSSRPPKPSNNSKTSTTRNRMRNSKKMALSQMTHTTQAWLDGSSGSAHLRDTSSWLKSILSSSVTLLIWSRSRCNCPTWARTDSAPAWEWCLPLRHPTKKTWLMKHSSSWTKNPQIYTVWSMLGTYWRHAASPNFTKNTWMALMVPALALYATARRFSQLVYRTPSAHRASKCSVLGARRFTCPKQDRWTSMVHTLARHSRTFSCSITLRLWLCHPRFTTMNPKSLASRSLANEEASSSIHHTATSKWLKTPCRRLKLRASKKAWAVLNSMPLLKIRKMLLPNKTRWKVSVVQGVRKRTKRTRSDFFICF